MITNNPKNNNIVNSSLCRDSQSMFFWIVIVYLFLEIVRVADVYLFLNEIRVQRLWIVVVFVSALFQQGLRVLSLSLSFS